MPDATPHQAVEIDRDDAASPNALPFRAAPHNIEAEQALLGAMLVNNEALDRVSSFLEPQHFYDPLHQQIFETAAKLIAAGKQATPITLKTFFETAEPIDATLTVFQYLGRLAANAATIINARDYGRTIYDLATRRQLILIGEDMVNVAYESPVDFPPKEQIDEAQVRLDGLRLVGSNERSAVPLLTAVDEAILEIDEAHRRGDGLAGISCGIPALDEVLGGLTPSALIVIAGRPSMGKTALVLNVAHNIAMRGRPVGFLSLEMPRIELALRELSAEVNVPMSDLQRGRIDGGVMRRLLEARERLKDSALLIDQSGGLTMPQLAAKLRHMRRKNKIEVAVIDYLQLVGGSVHRNQNRTQEITEITTKLKSLAKELGIPIIALSQLSREVEKRDDKRPQLSDLRDSGSIEQDADVVAFVFRTDYYVERSPPEPSEHEKDTKAFSEKYSKWQDTLAAARGKAEVIIAKLRNGARGTAHLDFDETTMTFTSPINGGRS